MSMNPYVSEYYRCSKQYIDRIDPSISFDFDSVLSKLPYRETQTHINGDFVWLLSNKGWFFSSYPPSTKSYRFPNVAPKDLDLEGYSKQETRRMSSKEACKITTTLDLDWCADFTKEFSKGKVFVEIQFGNETAAFRDACRFAITYRERRLDLGILVVMADSKQYFSHRLGSVSGMAEFETIRKTLAAINLECPIWLIGINPPPSAVQKTL